MRKIHPGGRDMAALRDGDRVLVIDRRLFKDDNTRLFVGVVEEYDAAVIRIRGYPFHLNPYEVSGAERHGEERVRIVSLTAGDPIYVLPRHLDVAKLQLRRSPKALTLSDGAALSLDLSEWLVRA
jgi:hypothetical protein